MFLTIIQSLLEDIQMIMDQKIFMMMLIQMRRMNGLSRLMMLLKEMVRDELII